MPCSRTEHLLREYFSDDLGQVMRAEIEQHVASCPDCAGELRQLRAASASLRQWQELPTPRWGRHQALFRRERGAQGAGSAGWRLVWQWFPAAACALMLGLLLFNTSVIYRAGTLQISFGAPAMADVEQRLVEFQQLQAQERARFADTLARFEQLRMQDLETIQASYELLADRDYETVQSLQQLVSLVGSTGIVTW